MKPIELRIGNWYMSVKFKTPVQCDLSDLYNLCANSDGAYNDPPIDDMFAPIPLTEDWLKKAGVNERNVLGETWNRQFIDNYEIPGWIKYVHELQNWYYWTFSKTELEINE